MHMHTCIHVGAWYAYFLLTVCGEKELESCVEEGKKNVEGMGGGGGREIRYEEVGGIRWKYLSLVFLFPLPSCVSLHPSTPPLARLLRVFGGRPSQSSRWPSPEPLSALEGLGLHAMHYLEVNGFVLAGKAAMNGHHYSFITTGTG